MIIRPDYINRIKPFIGLEPVKVLTGLRRSGKSVMLQLIQNEISSQGIPENNIISFNFENMSTPRTAEALHNKILEIVKAWVPFTYDAFVNYRQNVVSVSKKCIELNKRMLRGEKITQESSGLSKGEWQEFLTAFDLRDLVS